MSTLKIKVSRVWMSMLIAGFLAMVALPASAMRCIGESAPLFVFGAYDPQTLEHHDVQTIFNIHCAPDFRGEPLNLMIRLNGVGSGPLQMRNRDTGERLQFAAYRDPARSQPIDGLSSINFNFPLMAPTIISIPVYGRIPARQNVAVGSYYLPVSVVMTY